jgi:hypothetical protein
MDYEPTIDERQQVERYIATCEQADDPDPYDLLHLMRIERQTGTRPGLLAATWCVEASMRTRTKDGGPVLGDWRGGVAMARGPFQLWPPHRRACNLSDAHALELVPSAWCYAARIARVLPRARQRCPDAAERTAEAAIANIAKYRWSCTAGSKHWQLAQEMEPNVNP